jgi:hypothetical protein
MRLVMEDDAQKLLRIYLNDHRAGAAAGTALARRCLKSNAGSELAADLEAVANELEEDAALLDAAADRLSILHDPLKSAISRIGELLGRLKPNGRIREYSPLSRVLELEMLMAGIDAKRSLWRALENAALPVLSDFDLERLQQRAIEQRSRLVRHHCAAAACAFSRTPAVSNDAR